MDASAAHAGDAARRRADRHVADIIQDARHASPTPGITIDKIGSIDSGPAPQNVTYTYTVKNTSGPGRCRWIERHRLRRPLRVIRRTRAATPTATGARSTETWILHLHDDSTSAGHVHQHREACAEHRAQRLRRSSAHRRTTWTVDADVRRRCRRARSSRSPSARRRARSRAPTARPCAPASSTRSGCASATSTPARRDADHAPGRQKVDRRRPTRTGIATLQGAADEVRHGDDPGRGVLGRRAPDGQAGPAGRGAARAEGHRLTCVLEKYGSLAAVAVALIAAARRRTRRRSSTSASSARSPTSRSSRRRRRRESQPKRRRADGRQAHAEVARGHRRPRARSSPARRTARSACGCRCGCRSGRTARPAGCRRAR